ncbi:helix-turn-helix transcriptional regulator [Luedemannella flava]|uniref:Helix-turn-helix transcriptional regulator n=1 Tax=Luedemannella flava TaxID=349316 RepID=A0ABP4YXY8_9ACTN
MSQGPTIPRRRLRSELRAAREAVGFTQEQVAEELAWSTSKVIRIEAGIVGLSITDLRALLEMYEITNPARIRKLEEFARLSRKRSWWSAIKADEVSAQQRMLIGFEAEATKLRHFHPLLVPGLLQTEAYAAALLRDCAVPAPTEASFQTRMDVRLTRQQDTLERHAPPLVTAIIDEAALHRPVGGTETMREQLRHLLALGERANVEITILPWRVGAHPGMVHGGFTILQFDETADADVVYMEHGATDRVLTDDQEEIGKYWTIMQRLEQESLSVTDSRRLIERVLDGLD